jgi:hypothetical protein
LGGTEEFARALRDRNRDENRGGRGKQGRHVTCQVVPSPAMFGGTRNWLPLQVAMREGGKGKGWMRMLSMCIGSRMCISGYKYGYFMAQMDFIILVLLEERLDAPDECNIEAQLLVSTRQFVYSR